VATPREIKPRHSPIYGEPSPGSAGRFATAIASPQAILSRAPISPMRLNPELPSELERIINRALEKDRNLRYQHTSEMRAELPRLKRDTDSGSPILPTAPTMLFSTALCARLSLLTWSSLHI